MPETPNALLCGDLWSVFNFEDPNVRYQKFLGRGRPPIKHLVEGILLYPEVVVPTEDFLSLAVLVGVLGEHNVTSLLESKALRFIRMRGSLAYVGNGGGLQVFSISKSAKAGGVEASHAAPLHDSISWALSGLDDEVSESLVDVVAKSTTEVQAKQLIGNIRRETYADIGNSIGLRERFGLQEAGDLDRLQGVGPDQVRIYGGIDATSEPDAIYALLSIAHANAEMCLAQTVHAADISTSSPVGHILKGKAERSLPRTSATAFGNLCQIAEIPDVGESLLKREVLADDLLDLASTEDGQEFRRWFHEKCSIDPIVTGREYARLVGTVPAIQTKRMRVLRFLITQVIGVASGGTAGAAASATDAFLVDRWLRGHSPKFFIENLQAKMPSDVVTPKRP